MRVHVCGVRGVISLTSRFPRRPANPDVNLKSVPKEIRMPYRGTVVRAALLSTVLSGFAGLAFGQPSPPPGIEDALRARVTEFFQYHVDGNFRKAYDMVAEDTKDFYFKALKIQFKS